MVELIGNLASKTKLYVCVVRVFSKEDDLVITVFQSLGTLQCINIYTMLQDF